MNKTIAILGATGSVGQQALDVARVRGYRVDYISAGRNAVLAERIAREFRPYAVAMADIRSANELKFRLRDTPVKVLSGEGGICDGIGGSSADTVVNAILGKAGLAPTIATLQSGKRLALANKESLVIAGNIVMELAKKTGAEIIPVDSEHSAIFQSLMCGRREEIRRIILTASGGPFYGRSREELQRITLAETLAHPTWKMGRKIIEAAHLFSVSPDKIEVVIHRESILHSAVEYADSSIIGELSVPDMRMCVQYAVDYPNRQPGVTPPLDFTALGRLTFARPDTSAFPLLDMARRAFFEGGACPAVLNAADEVAVDAFLNEKIRFADIPRVVIGTYEMLGGAKHARTLDEIVAYDGEATRITEQYIK